MKSLLEPYYKQNIYGVTILWFKDSNKYLILDDTNSFLVDTFLKSNNYDHFNQLINAHGTYSKDVSSAFFFEIEKLLTTITTPEANSFVPNEITTSIHDIEKPFITIFYDFNGILFKVCYESTYEQNLIHPQFSYLEVENPKANPNSVIHIHSSNNFIHLFKDNVHLGSYKKSEYHFLQGKFAIELLCSLTKTKESNWLATFHASAVSNNSEAIMLIGESGHGKSTLTTILMDYGYHMLADDFTPINAKSKELFPYPSAISIKKNAFDLIESLSDRISYNTFQSPNGKKGILKYVTPINALNKPLPCNKIILVNYEKGSKTSLSNLNIGDALNVLIPDSWISPIPEHAQSFLDWLEQCEFYKLTYCKNNEAISVFKTLISPPIN